MSKYPSQMQDKFNLRFPDGMRDAIAERAKKNGRSMNSEIIHILQEALDDSKGLSDRLDIISFINMDDDWPKNGNNSEKITHYIERRTDELKGKLLNDIKSLLKCDK